METTGSTKYLQPTAKCKMANVLNFIKLHNLKVTYEEVIGYYDYGLFGGGKKAMLLTSEFIYSSQDGKVTQPLYFKDITNSSAADNYLFVEKNGKEEKIFLPVYNQYISEIINAILIQYPTKPIEQEAEEVSQKVQKALEEKLAELARLEKEGQLY